MDIAYIGQPYTKFIPIIKDKMLVADEIYLLMIKNKNFNVLNMVSMNGDFNHDNYQNFLM